MQYLIIFVFIYIIYTTLSLFFLELISLQFTYALATLLEQSDAQVHILGVLVAQPI